MNLLADSGVTFNSLQMLQNLAVGAVLGAAGQIARVVVGLKKTSDEATSKGQTFSQNFDGRQILVSLLLGAAAGIAASVALWDKMNNLDQTSVIALLGAGYSGADFLEGLMTKADAASKTIVDNISVNAGKLPSLR